MRILAERAFTATTVTTPGSPLTPSLYRDLVAERRRRPTTS
ncbi:hypothetical protein ACWGIU_25915 [Streptomyces sp. NPDC054840]